MSSGTNRVKISNGLVLTVMLLLMSYLRAFKVKITVMTFIKHAVPKQTEDYREK